jgi:hypothetical protein
LRKRNKYYSYYKMDLASDVGDYNSHLSEMGGHNEGIKEYNKTQSEYYKGIIGQAEQAKEQVETKATEERVTYGYGTVAGEVGKGLSSIAAAAKAAPLDADKATIIKTGLKNYATDGMLTPAMKTAGQKISQGVTATGEAIAAKKSGRFVKLAGTAPTLGRVDIAPADQQAALDAAPKAVAPGETPAPVSVTDEPTEGGRMTGAARSLPTPEGDLPPPKAPLAAAGEAAEGLSTAGKIGTALEIGTKGFGIISGGISAIEDIEGGGPTQKNMKIGSDMNIAAGALDLASFVVPPLAIIGGIMSLVGTGETIAGEEKASEAKKKAAETAETTTHEAASGEQVAVIAQGPSKQVEQVSGTAQSF